VVIIENRTDLVADNVPNLPRADVQREDSMHDCEDEEMNLVLDEAANTEV
jgi:hypothetical protein